MRRARSVALLPFLILVALLVGACGGDGDSDSSGTNTSRDQSGETPAPLEAGGEFRVCTDVPYPPAEYLEGNIYVGYEIDIMNEVAERLDTTAEYEKTLFDAIIPSLQAKKCDAIISSMNVNPERSEQVAFVTYMEIGQSLMVPADGDEEVATLDDLSGLSVAVQVGTTLKDALDAKSEELEAAGEEPIDVQSFPDGGSAAAALKAGRVDAFFADSPVVADYVNKDEASFAFAGEPIDPIPVGIALRLEDTELRDAIQDAMDAMYEDGTMDELLGQWNVEDFALDAGDTSEDVVEDEG